MPSIRFAPIFHEISAPFYNSRSYCGSWRSVRDRHHLHPLALNSAPPTHVRTVSKKAHRLQSLRGPLRPRQHRTSFLPCLLSMRCALTSSAPAPEPVSLAQPNAVQPPADSFVGVSLPRLRTPSISARSSMTSRRWSSARLKNISSSVVLGSKPTNAWVVES